LNSEAPPRAHAREFQSDHFRLLLGIPLGAALLTLMGGAIYLYWSRYDGRAALDRQIEEIWMQGRETEDALEFFAQGGQYESRPGQGTAEIDQKYVVPLIRQLRDEHGLKVLVIKRDDVPGIAMAVIAQAPLDRAERNRVRQTILAADDAFPGFAMQNWSHHWVSLDFLDKEEMDPLIRSGSLEKLQASQRRME